MSPSKTAEAEFTSEAWVPTTPGDRLEGRVVSVERAWSDYKSSYYPILRLDAEHVSVGGQEQSTDKVRAFHAFRAVALSQVLAKRPKLGEQVIVTYLGPRDPKPTDKGLPPVGYRLELPERGPEEQDQLYDSMEPSPQAYNPGEGI